MSGETKQKTDYGNSNKHSNNRSGTEIGINKEFLASNIEKNSVAVERSSRVYVILGWVCAAFTLFTSVYLSPLFAAGGVIFGILLNRQIEGSGNVLIISNIVLGIINIGLGVLYIIVRRMMLGY